MCICVAQQRETASVISNRSVSHQKKGNSVKVQQRQSLHGRRRRRRQRLRGESEMPEVSELEGMNGFMKTERQSAGRCSGSHHPPTTTTLKQPENTRNQPGAARDPQFSTEHELFPRTLLGVMSEGNNGWRAPGKECVEEEYILGLIREMEG